MKKESGKKNIIVIFLTYCVIIVASQSEPSSARNWHSSITG